MTKCCKGCGRTKNEIKNWIHCSEEWRDKILKSLPSRIMKMGLKKVKWDQNNIRSFVLSSLKNRLGTWTMGVEGATAEFTALPGQEYFIQSDGEAISVQTKNGAMRLLIDASISAFDFDATGSSKLRSVTLGKEKQDNIVAPNNVITCLGKDAGSLSNDKAKILFDLGLGRHDFRFGVRVGCGSSLNALKGSIGKKFEECSPNLNHILIKDSPTRVVETEIGRIEVEGRIPEEYGVSPEGPHTHLRMNTLKMDSSLTTHSEIPSSFTPFATFYPDN